MIDANERELWTNIGHVAGMTGATLSVEERFDFRIQAPRSEERRQLADDLCTKVIERLAHFNIMAEAEWEYDPAGYYTFTMTRANPPIVSPLTPGWARP